MEKGFLGFILYISLYMPSPIFFRDYYRPVKGIFCNQAHHYIGYGYKMIFVVLMG